MPHVSNAQLLTNAKIKAARYDGRNHCNLWDSRVRGLGIRIRKSGARTWLVRFRDASRKKRTKSLGAWTERERDGALTIAQARHEAQRFLAEVAAGRGRARHPKRLTLSQLWTDFDQRLRQLDRSPSTLRSYGYTWRGWIEPLLGDRPIVSLTPGDVADLHDRITRARKPVQANRAVGVLSSMLGYAARKELIEGNPCSRFRGRHKARRGARVLSTDEQRMLLRALNAEEEGAWRELEALPSGRVTERARLVARLSAAVGLRVVWYSGTRPSEVLNAKWQDVDIDEGYLQPSRRKTRDHNPPIPLGPHCVKCLRRLARVADVSEWLVPSRMYPGRHLSTFRCLFQRLRDVAGLPKDLNLLCLRRTAATTLRDCGVPIAWASVMLGHSRISTTEKHYAIGRLPEGIRASNRHEKHIGALLESEVWSGENEQH